MRKLAARKKRVKRTVSIGRVVPEAVSQVEDLDSRIEAIQWLIPLGLKAVTEELQRAVIELAGPRYERKESDQPLRMLKGIATRNYEVCAEAVPEAFGLSSSSVSRRYVKGTARKLAQFQERSLEDMTWRRCFWTARASRTRKSSSLWASPSTDRRSLWASYRRPRRHWPRSNRVWS